MVKTWPSEEIVKNQLTSTHGSFQKFIDDIGSLSNQLTQVSRNIGDMNVLQKIKLDMQVMLNELKLESTKIPLNSRSAKRLYENMSANQTNEHQKLSKFIRLGDDNKGNVSISENQVLPEKIPRLQPILPKFITLTKDLTKFVNVNKGTDSNETNPEKSSPQKNKQIPNFNPNVSNVTRKPLQTLEPTRVGELSSEKVGSWINDSNLGLHLTRESRDSILSGQPITIETICCVQTILRRQCPDLQGLQNPDRLSPLPNEVVSNDKVKIAQIHNDNGHWVTSVKTGENLLIFCCSQASKAVLVEQVLQINPKCASLAENILFVEREEDVKRQPSCGLFAIAYLVAAAFDIEPKGLHFSACDMRSHLVECLEEKCFSMFPCEQDS